MINLLFMPCIGTMLWAIYTKYQQRKIKDMILISTTSIAAMVNVVLVHAIVTTGISPAWHLVQMLSSAVIIPQMYMYFAGQVGRQTPDRTTTTLLWLLVPVTCIPIIVIDNPFEPFVKPDFDLKPFCLYFLSGGKKVFGIYTGDAITIIQAALALLRIIPFMIMLREHNLHLNSRVYSFAGVWLLVIVFVFMVSSMSLQELSSTFGTYFYFVGYAMLDIYFNVLMALRYDEYPVETEHGEAVEDLEVYVKQQYARMSYKLNLIMTERQLFANPQLSAETVIDLLETNHTYFSQMMSHELGMTFSEYLNNLRLTNVERLLTESDTITIAAAATQSGFTDSGYMSRRFKMKYGVTPSEWRKMQ